MPATCRDMSEKHALCRPLVYHQGVAFDHGGDDELATVVLAQLGPVGIGIQAE